MLCPCVYAVHEPYDTMPSVWLAIQFILLFLQREEVHTFSK